MSIAQSVAAYMTAKGATIVAAPLPANFGDVASLGPDTNIQLDCHLLYEFVGVTGFDLTETFARMFYESIRARVQATLVPAGHCTERVATLDSIEPNGNSIKVRMVKNRQPMGQVFNIGGEVYGVVGVHDLKTRHRLILDRPLRHRPTKGTQITGIGVATNPPFNSFKGVTVVSASRPDVPDASLELDTYEGLHFRTLRTPEGNSTRSVIETLFGLYVDSTTASLR